MPMFLVKFMVSLSLGEDVDLSRRERFVTTIFSIYSRGDRDRSTPAQRQTGAALAGAAGVSRSRRNLCRTPEQSRDRPRLAIADTYRRAACADGRESSHGQALAQSRSRNRDQFTHHAGADRLGCAAGAGVAVTSGIAARIAALRSFIVAYQRNRVRTLVLAIGWRWPNPASRREKVRQHQFPFPANASSA